MSLRLEKPAVYLITPGEATDSTFAPALSGILDIVRVAIEEKVSLIQLREKRLSAKLLFHLTLAVAALTRRSDTRLLVNDRADIALAARADGVHLAANSIGADVIRKNFPPGFIVGVSTHSLDAAVDASKQGADFVVFGPVFGTVGKGQPRGLDELRNMCDRLRPFPVVGLGGIDETNFESVLEVGASGIAAIRALNDPVSLRSIMRKLKP